MHTIKAIYVIFILAFSLVGYASTNPLTAITAGMTPQQVVSIMGSPADSATQQDATLLLYTKHFTMTSSTSFTVQHFIFIDNKLVEYGEKNEKMRQTAFTRHPAAEQLKLWLSEQGKPVNLSATAGCQRLNQQSNCTNQQ